MKMVECHIENFGKLHDLDYQFQDGVNVLLEENGWGKTTFAAFIKAMFYGMISTTKRSVLENERKKYMPWQGGTYGGSLIFENEQGTYQIERFFGEKDKDDIFRLYNHKTGLESQDYSAAIGEELFGINMEGYERSAYIPQLGLEITANDSINAKLSHLLDDGNDINNYETALSSLEEAMKVYKKTGNRGRIGELETRLSTVERELEKTAGTEEAIPIWEIRFKDKKEEFDHLSRTLQEMKQKIVTASHYEAQKAKREHYAQLCEEKNRIEESRKNLQQFFRGQEPSEEELQDKIEKHYALSELNAKIEAETEKKDFYEKEYQKEQTGPKDHTKITAYVIGVCALVLLGAAVFMILRFAFLMTGIAAAVAGLVMMILCLVFLKKSSVIQADMERKRNEMEEHCRLAREHITSMQQIRQEHEAEIAGLVRFYFSDMKPSEARECLEELKTHKQSMKNIEEEYKRACEAVQQFEEQNHIGTMEQSSEQETEGQSYETLNELQKKENDTAQQLEALRTEITSIEEKLNQLNQKLEERMEYEGEKERLLEQLAQGREHYEVLEDTVKYLKKAKENLSTHYFGDIQSHFEHYIKILCQSLSGTAGIDIKLNVKVNEGGAKRDLDFYSEGYKDLIAICSRLALISVLFEGERPFIIMDDPFANLDEEKLNGMLKLLQTIGEDYQILYFVCHNSRSL